MLVRLFETEKTAEPTLYSELVLACFADIKLVKKRYYELALIHHPDKGGKEENFKRIGHAYYVLGDAERKAYYDELLRNGEATDEFILKTFEEYLDQLAETLIVDMRTEFKNRDLEKTHVKLSDKPVPPLNIAFRPDRQLKQVYYIFGKPIIISACAGKLRDEIPAQEIQASFQDLDNVILFEEYFQASYYSWATRQGNFYNDEQCYQSAVATVKVLKPIEGKPYQLECWINERYKDKRDGATKSDSPLICLDAHMNDLELVSANMIVQTAKRGYFFKTYDGGEFISFTQKRNP